MTVKELKEELNNYDENSKIYIVNNEEAYYGEGYEIKAICEIKSYDTKSVIKSGITLVY